MRRTRSLLPVLLVAVLVACGGGTGRAKRAAGAKDGITVETVGTAPLVPLRLRVQEGQRYSAIMTFRFGFDLQGMEQRDVRLPAIRLGMNATVERVDAREIMYSFRFTSFDLVGRASGAVEEALRSALEKITDARGTETITTTGRGISSDVDLPEGLGAELGLDQLTQQFQEFTSVFPEEPIGVGARWRVTSRVKVSGIETTTTYENELLEIDGDHYRIDTTLEQFASPQTIEVQGQRAEVRSYSMRGGGTIEGVTTSLFPAASSLRADGMMQFVAAGQNFTQNLDLELSLESV